MMFGCETFAHFINFAHCQYVSLQGDDLVNSPKMLAHTRCMSQTNHTGLIRWLANHQSTAEVISSVASSRSSRR